MCMFPFAFPTVQGRSTPPSPGFNCTERVGLYHYDPPPHARHRQCASCHDSPAVSRIINVTDAKTCRDLGRDVDESLGNLP